MMIMGQSADIFPDKQGSKTHRDNSWGETGRRPKIGIQFQIRDSAVCFSYQIYYNLKLYVHLPW